MISVDASANVLWSLAALVAALAVATIVVLVMARRRDAWRELELVQRVRTWWVILLVFGLALILSKIAALIVFGFISFLALKEYISLIPTRRTDRRVLFWAYLAIPIQYYWVATGWYGMFIIFIPVYMFLGLAARMVLEGVTDGFLRAAGTLHWGLMITVFGLSHAAYLMVLPPENNPVAGAAGLTLFLVMLTQVNDICQYIWGRTLGQAKVVKSVSPNKTWAGLIGGVVSTTALAALAAPWLTPFSLLHAVIAGVIIGISGFFGDVTISALKRDLGVKDTGRLLPGHGGILDRVDSLTFTAPLFFHFTYYFYY